MLIKPILFAVPSFDASGKMTFAFKVQAGGPQITANQLTIRNQTNNQVVYEGRQETYRYEHILPASTLANGEYYNATVTIFDATGDASPASAPIQFRCYSTPSIVFSNLPAGNVIANANYNFAFTYNQAEGESLNNFTMNLYNSSEKLLSTSELIFVENGKPPYTGEYLFAGFEDKSIYYVEVIGQTVNNTVVKSQRVRIEIQYDQPSLFTLLNLENDCLKGCVTISSDLSIIEGETVPATPTYIGGTEIDLTGEGNYVKWVGGYTIPDNFVARIWFRSPKPYERILKFSNVDGQVVSIYFAKGYENVMEPSEKVYLQVYINSNDVDGYYIYSNYVEELPAQSYYNVQFEKVGPLCQVKLLTNF